MTNGTSRPRKQFLDVLRVMATCAVVMMHVLTGSFDVTDASKMPEYRRFLLAIMDLVTWCVPVFLLISGYLFLDPKRKLTYPVMLGKYCRRIALAILLFGVPYAASELVVAERTFRIGMLPEAVRMTLSGNTWSHMWYLYLILLLYLITPLLKKVLEVIPVWGVGAVMAVLFLGSSVAPFVNKVCNISSIPVLPDSGVYLFYYLCGYLFVRTESGVDREKKETVMGSDVPGAGKGEVMGSDASGAGKVKVCLIAALALAFGMVLSRTVAGFPVQMAYNYPFTVALALLIFAVGRGADSVASAGEDKESGQDKRSARPGRYITRSSHRIPWQDAGLLSFAVYLVHPVYINLFYKFFQFTPFTLLEQCGVESVAAGHTLLLLLLAVFCLVVLVLATATAWLLRKIPLLRKYVL